MAENLKSCKFAEIGIQLFDFLQTLNTNDLSPANIDKSVKITIRLADLLQIFNKTSPATIDESVKVTILLVDLLQILKANKLSTATIDKSVEITIRLADLLQILNASKPSPATSPGSQSDNTFQSISKVSDQSPIYTSSQLTYSITVSTTGEVESRVRSKEEIINSICEEQIKPPTSLDELSFSQWLLQKLEPVFIYMSNPDKYRKIIYSLCCIIAIKYPTMAYIPDVVDILIDLLSQLDKNSINDTISSYIQYLKPTSENINKLIKELPKVAELAKKLRYPIISQVINYNIRIYHSILKWFNYWTGKAKNDYCDYNSVYRDSTSLFKLIVPL